MTARLTLTLSHDSEANPNPNEMLMRWGHFVTLT